MTQTDIDLTLARTQPGVLNLICRKCTRAEVVRGISDIDAIHHARTVLGWAVEPDGRVICPRCPAARIRVKVAA